MLVASPEVIATLYREFTPTERAEHDASEAETEKRSRARAAAENRTSYIYEAKPAPARIVDFAAIVPPPPNIETGGCTGTHADGVVCWYEWNVANWGTKWGGYSASDKALPGDLCELRFDTAWSHPYPIITALAARHPGEPIYVQYADEALGRNLAAYVIIGGADGDLGAGLLLQAVEGPGILDSETLDVICADARLDSARCMEIAAPPEYAREASAATNDRATGWARMLKYGQTNQEAKIEEDAWEQAYNETQHLPSEEQSEARGKREAELIAAGRAAAGLPALVDA